LIVGVTLHVKLTQRVPNTTVSLQNKEEPSIATQLSSAMMAIPSPRRERGKMVRQKTTLFLMNSCNCFTLLPHTSNKSRTVSDNESIGATDCDVVINLFPTVKCPSLPGSFKTSPVTASMTLLFLFLVSPPVRSPSPQRKRARTLSDSLLGSLSESNLLALVMKLWKLRTPTGLQSSLSSQLILMAMLLR
jgi:hypothetical protein